MLDIFDLSHIAAEESPQQCFMDGQTDGWTTFRRQYPSDPKVSRVKINKFQTLVFHRCYKEPKKHTTADTASEKQTQIFYDLVAPPGGNDKRYLFILLVVYLFSQF